MFDNASCSTKYWRVLAEAIRTGSLINVNDCKHLNLQRNLNVNEFEKKLFLFKKMETKIQDIGSVGYVWFELFPCLFNEECLKISEFCLTSLRIRLYTSLTDLEVCDRDVHRDQLLQTLSGFDNTGNIMIWFCELLLSHCMLFEQCYPVLWNKLIDNFKSNTIKNVCELGSGMTGCAGLALSLRKNSQLLNISYILLTDGNERCVESMIFISSEHKKRLDYSKQSNSSVTPVIKARKLCWPSESNIDGEGLLQIDESLFHYFDLILTSDCFFNREYHQGLLYTIDQLLSTNPGSTFIAIAPLRNGSLMQFVSNAHKLEPEKWTVSCMSPKEYMSQKMYNYLFQNFNGNQEINPSFEQLDKLVGHLVILTRV